MQPDEKPRKRAVVTLKAVAERVSLSPGTVSAVLNDAPSARHIPKTTRARILQAARELNYRPNFFARSLRKKRTYTIGVLVHDIGDDYSALVVAGIENHIRERDYFFITGIHRHDPGMVEKYTALLLERGVEGFITVDLNLENPLPLPTVAISGHRRHAGVTNIVLDHRHAATLALQHLRDFGHKHIAVLRGHSASADANDRWTAIAEVAAEMKIELHPELVVQIESDESSPSLGYPYAKELLARRRPFTALFAFNDISAIGAIRAFHEAGLRVPTDISVVGFDDIAAAAFHSPALTTVRQPLRRMGEIAAKTLLERIEGSEQYPQEIAVEPELAVRESTSQAPLR